MTRGVLHGRMHDSRRIVVKIGSALLVDGDSGTIRHDWLRALADDIAGLKAAGAEVVVVSSGAVAAGRGHLGLTGRPLRLEEKQAAAATGQLRLAHAYQTALAAHDITVAQVLVTLDDTEERRRHLNARATLETLLHLGAVPVVNENDTVATAEIRFGDNDRLGARVAQMITADTLILLSDIDGLYTADPKRDPTAAFLPEVAQMTPEIEAMAGEALPGYSSGGMVTKLTAAKIAMQAGCRMAIARGQPDHALATVAAGGRATWFLPTASPMTARKRWIAGFLNPLGRVVVDAGAAAALGRGKSLLPAGVKRVEGSFDRGDPVAIVAEDGTLLARGLSAYGAADAAAIAGRRSDEIETVLGFRGRTALVHRDDLVVVGADADAPTQSPPAVATAAYGAPRSAP